MWFSIELKSTNPPGWMHDEGELLQVGKLREGRGGGREREEERERRRKRLSGGGQGEGI